MTMMRSLRVTSRLLVTTALLPSLVACSSSLQESEFAAGPLTDAGSTTVSADGYAPLSSHCPAAPPTGGATCTIDGLQCEYGASVWSVACNEVFECSQGSWRIAFPGGPTCVAPPAANSAECPAAYHYESGSCTEAGLHCAYPAGDQCDCVSTAAGVEWVCMPVTTCPTARPRLGTVCEGYVPCDYPGNYGCGYVEVCADGTWHGGWTGC